MKPSICKSSPKVPTVPGKLRLRAWGLVHTALFYISEWYCAYFGIPFDVNIIQLPFGLVLKRTDRISLEEAAAMQIAGAAGMPVPKVLSCGEHPNAPYNRFFSILMTRLPGLPLGNSSDTLLVESEEPRLFELKECVGAMRVWTSPDSKGISSVVSTSLQSTRVPDHIMGPFADENELHDFLLSPASGHGFDTTAEYIEALAQANEIRNYPHRITLNCAKNAVQGSRIQFPAFADVSSIFGLVSIRKDSTIVKGLEQEEQGRGISLTID